MLDDYKDGQPILYKIFKNSLEKDMLSHAYLIETNDTVHTNNIILSVIKSILCPNHLLKNEDCLDCNICLRIDSNNYPEVTIINPDGLYIKKDQLIDLKKEVLKKGIESNKRIYVINEAEKLNKQAANSVLKFLEEPEEGIIAFIVTNNVNMMIDTIVSRCQVISLRKEKKSYSDSTLMNYALYMINKKEELDSFISDNKNKDILDKIVKFIIYLENNKIDTIIVEKELWLDNFKSREDNINAIDLMIMFYNDCLMNSKNYFFIDYINNIDEVKNKNDNSVICNKIELLINTKDNIKHNLNINLMIDKLIIEFGGE